MHRVFGEMYNLKTIAGLLVRLPADMAAAARGRRSKCPIRWICRRRTAISGACMTTCWSLRITPAAEVFRLAKAKIPQVEEQIAAPGAMSICVP